MERLPENVHSVITLEQWAKKHGEAALAMKEADLLLSDETIDEADYPTSLTINGQKRRIQQHCPLLALSPLAPVAIAEPSGDFKTRQEQHKALINQLAAKYQIDPALVHAVVSVESGYRSSAVSGKGAVGLMQLMPGTAGDMNVTDPYNPANNLEGGIKYLSQQLSRFQNTEQALAAYNAGPQSLLRYRGQIPPYNETRQYIQRVMHYKNRYQNDWQQHIK